MLDEKARLKIMRELGTARSGTSDALHAVARLAAHLCGTPMAAVSLLGLDEQVFVGSTGLAVDRTDRASSFCSVAMETPELPLIVPDTGADPRFADNALVVGAPHIRAYAGVPLLAVEGVPLGAVCVLSDRPHALSDPQLDALRALAMIAGELLQAERVTGSLKATLNRLAASHAVEQASQAQFRVAFDHATTGMTLVDDSGSYVRVNRTFAELLGYTVDEVVGRNFREITEDADQNADIAAITDLLSGHRGAALREKRYRHRDGTLIPALVSSSLIQPAPGGPWQLLNTVESLAERRAAEARLMELHSAVDGIVTIDDNALVVAWNLGAQRLLGHAAADMLGRRLDRIIPAHLRAAHNAGIARIAAGGPTRLLGSTVEVPVIHADGHELLAELSLSAWQQDGRPRYTAILRDITAQRRVEHAAALVRHAATTANSADTFAEAAAAIVKQGCTLLGWRAGQAWTRDGGPGVWHVADHPHDAEPAVIPGHPCPLQALADRGTAPTSQQLPYDSGAQVAHSAAELAPMGAAPQVCGLGGAVAVPVLAGGEIAGMLAFYLPADGAVPHSDVLAALEQVGLALGRVVERQRTAATLTWRANHDPVTELANRRLLLERISAAQDMAADARGSDSSVMVINLDRFRLVNDSLGYAAGDEVLRAVARRLQHSVREGDLVARLSADEFAVLAHPGADGADEPLVTTAQRLLQAVREPLHVAGHQMRLHAGIGICPIGPSYAARSHNPALVLRDADAALRHGKRRGQDQVHVFDATLAGTTAQRIDDETALAQAIVRDELRVHYQPIISLDTGRVAGAEALVRWQRPGHGMVYPDRFIALAEESGLIVDLGRWVLHRACHDAAGWRDTVPAMRDASVSVNVSARQLTHPRFLEDLDTALAGSRLARHRLILEITETALIAEPEAVMDTLHAIRRRGVHLALDDFGTGYSSLSHVQQLPATIVKIDKSFVDPITAPGEGTALSEVVVKLASATGMRTVAEGVETPEQAAALRLLGCERGQGYTWSKPVPLERLRAAVEACSPQLVTDSAAI